MRGKLESKKFPEQGVVPMAKGIKPHLMRIPTRGLTVEVDPVEEDQGRDESAGDDLKEELKNEKGLMR